MATKIRQSNLDTSVVTGLTELAEARADGDFVLVYDASAGALKKIQGSNLGLVGPKITSVTPTNALTGDGTGNHTFIINGTNFASGATASLKKSDGTAVAFDTLTRNSDIKLTGVVAKSSMPGAGEPYDVTVTANQLTVTLTDQINIDQSPVFSTNAGSLGTILNGLIGSTTKEVVATDPESAGNVSFEIQSGSLPAGATGATLNENGVSKFRISGFNAVGSDTTSNFVLRAVDAASNTTSRAFAITVNAPVSQSFTSSGTFSVPSGVANVDVLVVAGGAGGGNDGSSGGGGAGGLIFMPNSPVTPGGTVSVTVGSGGGAQTNGQDSAFGTLTAKGGGTGGRQPQGQSTGQPGGNGGGAGRGDYGGSGGPGTQPTQPGNSGAYGFGNNGGNSIGQAGVGGAGGGGAGGTGGQSQYVGSAGWGGAGGSGKFYTIADGTSPIGYAGGGAGLGGSKVNSNPNSYNAGGGGPLCTTEYPSQGEAIGATRNGQANRGGGGAYHATGGKGVVIVRY